MVAPLRVKGVVFPRQGGPAESWGSEPPSPAAEGRGGACNGILGPGFPRPPRQGVGGQRGGRGSRTFPDQL